MVRTHRFALAICLTALGLAAPIALADDVKIERNAPARVSNTQVHTAPTTQAVLRVGDEEMLGKFDLRLGREQTVTRLVADQTTQSYSNTWVPTRETY